MASRLSDRAQRLNSPKMLLRMVVNAGATPVAPDQAAAGEGSGGGSAGLVAGLVAAGVVLGGGGFLVARNRQRSRDGR